MTQRDLEDILPLAPLQEGLLFHALYDEQAPDVYVTQLCLGVEGPLHPGVLKASVHALLRPAPTCVPGSCRRAPGPCRSSPVRWTCRGRTST